MIGRRLSERSPGVLFVLIGRRSGVYGTLCSHLFLESEATWDPRY
jgi:hypothetical protein